MAEAKSAQSAKAVVKAMCILIGEQVKGQVAFEQSSAGGPTHITGRLTGFPKAGKYGFHIHEFGDLSRGCDSAGAHYNPLGVTHGAPTDPQDNRHFGDLGNIVADDQGVAVIDITDSLVSLVGQYSVIGRAVVAHEKEDDLGRGGNPDSKKTGNAGGRKACGVIGLAN